jgi:crotonobetainyl-CoA:carnitine CoA-transferase CaiB-like acyl-CoA transferase
MASTPTLQEEEAMAGPQHEGSSSSTPTGPLRGIRVLEIATVLLAPYATQLLADLGADVIKVESDALDASRVMGAGPHDRLSGVALNILRNKRSVQVDLKSKGGRAVLTTLLASSDVLVTNMRPGAMERLGLHYDGIRALNPTIIHCEVHGFGSDTPEAERPAFDDVIQAETGMPWLSDRAGNGMRFVSALLADKVGGMFIAYGVLGAIVHRERTGEGQHVEVPMFDSLLAFNLVEHLAAAAFPGHESGYTRILTRHRGPHRTQDGYLAILPYTDRHWDDLYKVVGHGDELSRPEFAGAAQRHKESEKVYSSLAAIISERPTAYWIDLCTQLGIPFGRVASLDEIIVDPAQHRGLIRERVHPVIGPYRSVASPVRYSATPLGVHRDAPLPGADTREVLLELGLGQELVEELIRDGAVSQTPE